MTPLLLLVAMSLSVFRLTRLFVADDFPPVLWVRDRLAGGWRPLTTREREMKDQTWTVQEIDGVDHRYVHRSRRSPSWLGDLVSCPWCVSGWVAGAVTAATDTTVGIPAPVLMGLSCWALGALLAART